MKSAHIELSYSNNNLSDPTNPADEMEAMEGANEDSEVMVPPQKNISLQPDKNNTDYIRPPAKRSSHMELMYERYQL